MAREPQRRDEPRHLDAAIVPLERALIARAKALSQEVIDEPDAPEATDEQAMIAGVTQVVRALFSRELLALADELHHW